MRELLEQQRYSPRPALVRMAERAERLAGEIDPDGLYDERWLTERVTGYHGEIEEPALVTGSALLGDLSALVERLCESAALRESDLPASSASPEELARRLGVARRTIERYRRQGLVARRVRDERGRVALRFTPEAVQRFSHRRRTDLDDAKKFSRVSQDEAQSLYDAAIAKLGGTHETPDAASAPARSAHEPHGGLTPVEAIAAVAAERGRSVTAVRRAVLAVDRATGNGRFTPRWRKTEIAARRRIARAMDRGLKPGDVARRWARSSATVQRIWLEERARRLREITADFPTPERDERVPPAPEESGTNAADSVRFPHVDSPAWPSDVRRLVETVHAMRPIDAPTERAIAATHRALALRAARVAATISHRTPNSPLIDRVETDLRAALALRRELLRLELPLVLRTIESLVGGSPLLLTPTDMGRTIALAVGATNEALASAPRLTSGRLAAPVSLAVNRALAGARLPRVEPGRAASNATLPPAVFQPAPWAPLVEPRQDLHAVLADIAEADARLVALRYGWSQSQHSRRPLTVREVSEITGATPPRVANAWRRALAAAKRRAAS